MPKTGGPAHPEIDFLSIFREDFDRTDFFAQSFEKISTARTFSANLSRRFARADFFLPIFREDLPAQTFFCQSFEKIPSSTLYSPLGRYLSSLPRLNIGRAWVLLYTCTEIFPGKTCRSYPPFTETGVLNQ